MGGEGCRRQPVGGRKVDRDKRFNGGVLYVCPQWGGRRLPLGEEEPGTRRCHCARGNPDWRSVDSRQRWGVISSRRSSGSRQAPQPRSLGESTRCKPRGRGRCAERGLSFSIGAWAAAKDAFRHRSPASGPEDSVEKEHPGAPGNRGGVHRGAEAALGLCARTTHSHERGCAHPLPHSPSPGGLIERVSGLIAMYHRRSPLTGVFREQHPLAASARTQPRREGLQGVGPRQEITRSPGTENGDGSGLSFT